VAIGGGTGLSSLLRGLRQYTSNLTAIVTVRDDGGSSGRRRRNLRPLPPGDFRQPIAALADADPLVTRLVVRSLLDAGLIVLGPGSLDTSILPNLLVDDLARALCWSRAHKIYVCNRRHPHGPVPACSRCRPIRTPHATATRQPTPKTTSVTNT
jgi:2-phospho-L-lactate transferase/gluconeogenesis factor (CofD/UPF0052 family)